MMRNKTDWHNWFAWYPVKTETREWAWLEIVERKKGISRVCPGRINGYIYLKIDNKPVDFIFST